MILIWLPGFMGELTLITAFAPRDWHVDEMLYGYLLLAPNRHGRLDR